MWSSLIQPLQIGAHPRACPLRQQAPWLEPPLSRAIPDPDLPRIETGSHDERGNNGWSLVLSPHSDLSLRPIPLTLHPVPGPHFLEHVREPGVILANSLWGAPPSATTSATRRRCPDPSRHRTPTTLDSTMSCKSSALHTAVRPCVMSSFLHRAPQGPLRRLLVQARRLTMDKGPKPCYTRMTRKSLASEAAAGTTQAHSSGRSGGTWTRGLP